VPKNAKGLLIATAALAALLPHCSGDECEPVLAFPIDLEAGCYGEPIEVPALKACREETEKGTMLVCVVSPEGVIHFAAINTAATLEGLGWRFDAALSDDEVAGCDQAAEEIGFPGDANACEIPDGGSEIPDSDSDSAT
jgi:hypothetical protein